MSGKLLFLVISIFGITCAYTSEGLAYSRILFKPGEGSGGGGPYSGGTEESEDLWIKQLFQKKSSSLVQNDQPKKSYPQEGEVGGGGGARIGTSGFNLPQVILAGEGGHGGGARGINKTRARAKTVFGGDMGGGGRSVNLFEGENGGGPRSETFCEEGTGTGGGHFNGSGTGAGGLKEDSISGGTGHGGYQNHYCFGGDGGGGLICNTLEILA